MRILIVEDEPGIVSFVRRGLEARGHQVVDADNGVDGIIMALDERTDLLLLDIALPGIDGHEVLARVRARRPALPVLMLTARDTLSEKVTALNAGADDYLTKPFAFDELLARIHALSRRSDQHAAAVLELGPLRLDLLARRAWHGERQLDLTNREFTLLEYFMRHPGQVLSRAQLLAAVWEQDFDPGSNVVDVYVRYLRRKVDDPGAVSLIETVRGAGYRLELTSSR